MIYEVGEEPVDFCIGSNSLQMFVWAAWCVPGSLRLKEWHIIATAMLSVNSMMKTKTVDFLKTTSKEWDSNLLSNTIFHCTGEEVSFAVKSDLTLFIHCLASVDYPILFEGY